MRSRSDPTAPAIDPGVPPTASAPPRAALLGGRIELTEDGEAAAAAAGIALVMYLRSMLPGVSVGDWAEMQLIPAQLGVPHPTGYPIYVLVGKLFSLLPVGSIAFRATLLSGVAASAAVAVAVMIATRLGVRPVIALAAGLALAFSGTLWLEATYPEMNGLHLLLVGLVIHRALVWREERRDRDLLLGAFLAGLALSNHLLALTTVPIVVAYVLWAARRRLIDRPVLLLQGGLLFGLGLAPYLFIPLRAMAGPPEVYGALATWDGFWHLVTGADFRENMHFFTADSVGTVWRTMPGIVAHVVERSSALFLGGGIVGLALLLRRDPWLATLFGLLTASGIYFLVNYIADLYHYLLVGWLVLAIALAVLGESLIRRLHRPLGRTTNVAVALLLLVPLSIGVGQAPSHDQSRNLIGDRLAEEVFSLLPQNAVLVTYWDVLTTLSYKHCIEGVRPDLTLRAIDVSARVTCDRVVDPIEDEVRAGRPVFALYAIPAHVETLRESFDLVPGPILRLPYGQRFRDQRGVLFRLQPKGEAGAGG